MALMDMLIGTLFGGGRNVVKDTAEVFRANAEASAVRAQDLQVAAMNQFAAEFAHPKKGWFDRFIDGVNRIPRPAMALGVLGLLVSAMIDPVWFASRMQGLAVVPQPLWWVVGIVVGFYFGARHQAKGQEFQRSIAASMAATPMAVANIRELRALEVEDSEITPGVADAGTDTELELRATTPNANPALDAWRQNQRG